MCINKMRERKEKKLDRTIVCKVSPVVYTYCALFVIIFAIAMTVVATSYNLLWLLAIPVALGVATFIYCDLLTKNTIVMFKDGLLTLRHGIISSSSTEIPSVNVLSITIEKGLYSHIFKYGNLTLVTANGTYYFKKMRDPEKFVAETSEYLVSITRRA